MSNAELVAPGTRVQYWGRAANNAYYGQEFVVLWANQCSCAHQTYAIRNEDGKELSKVLRDSFTLITEEGSGENL